MRKNLKTLLSKRILIVALSCGLLISPFTFAKTSAVSAEDTAAPNVAFGVISDIHLNDSTTVQQEETNLKKALTKFKENNIQVLLVAGDIANAGGTASYNKFNRIFNEVFTDTATAPKKLMVMGNHDYWNGLSVADAQKRFCDTLGVTLNTNLEVNGYHFIGVSTEDGTTSGKFTSTSTSWLKAQLDAAKAEDPNKPIFVVCHQHITGTVYCSDEWGNPTLDTVLKDYPQVVSFSGHSHAVLDDERSIYQKNYTAVGTCTLSYTELESGKVNGSVPPDASKVAEGLIGKVTDTAVDLERYDFHNDCKIKNDWVIDVPVNKANFKYTDARYQTSVAPYFPDGSKITATNVSKTFFTVTVDAAKDADLVQSYRVQAINKSTGEEVANDLYFSDFYLGLPNMASTQSFVVSGLKADTEYTVKVSAIESFGKESTPLTITQKTAGDNNEPAKDVMNVNFSDGTGKDSSSYNTAFELKNNAKIENDSTLNKNVLVLDGSSYVNYKITDSQLATMTNSFTLEAIFKMNTIANQAIIENCQSSGIGFESTSSGLVELWARIGGSYQKVGVQLEANKYYDLVATYDGSTLSLYLDGKLVKTKSVTGTVNYTSGVAMCLGGDPDTAGNANINLNGSIALARVMDKAISAADVLNNYNSFYGITPTTTTSETTTTDTTETATTSSTGSATNPTSSTTESSGTNPTSTSTTSSSSTVTTTSPSANGTTTVTNGTDNNETTVSESSTDTTTTAAAQTSPKTGSTTPGLVAALAVLSILSAGLAMKKKKEN